MKVQSIIYKKKKQITYLSLSIFLCNSRVRHDSQIGHVSIVCRTMIPSTIQKFQISRY